MIISGTTSNGAILLDLETRVLQIVLEREPFQW